MNHQNRRPDNHGAGPVTYGLAIAATALGVIALGLLVAGSMAGHIPLLAWGVVTGGGALALGSLTVLRLMIESAVRRSVDRTAVRVGVAIAEGLANGEPLTRPSDDGKVSTLYS